MNDTEQDIMTKAKNISYIKSYEKNLERDIKQADDKRVRINMRQLKDKDELKDVKAIIKDLEKNG